jgi:hypothetical protein
MVDMRRSPGRYALWTVLPLTVFVAGTAAVILGPPIFADDDGLGTGLLMFAAYGFVAFVCGGLEGLSGVPLPLVAVSRVVVASTAAVTIGVCNYWGYFGQGIGSFGYELVDSVVLLSILIAGSAALESILGRCVLGTRSAEAER